MVVIDYGIVMQALLGDESECGDLAIVKEYDQHCFLALIDVLGHGKPAREVALIAKDYIDNNYKIDLITLINGLNKVLRKTRGAVAALIRFDIDTGKFSYVGVGNITVRALGRKPFHLVPKEGIVGYIMPNAQIQTLDLLSGDILLMYSDGIKEHFNSSECADLLLGSAQDIASKLFKKYGKGNDDSSIIVFKYSD